MHVYGCARARACATACMQHPRSSPCPPTPLALPPPRPPSCSCVVLVTETLLLSVPSPSPMIPQEVGTTGDDAARRLLLALVDPHGPGDGDTDLGFTADLPAPGALPPETLGREQEPQGLSGSGEYGSDADEAGAGHVGEENRPNNLRDQVFDIVRPTGWTEELPEPPGSIPGHPLSVSLSSFFFVSAE
jgi:hypothetical protein